MVAGELIPWHQNSPKPRYMPSLQIQRFVTSNANLIDVASLRLHCIHCGCVDAPCEDRTRLRWIMSPLHSPDC